MLLLALLFICILTTGAEPKVGNKDLDYLQLRAMGFEAYAEQRNTDAAMLFTRAIDNYWLRRQVVSMCIEQCSGDTGLLDEVQSISLYLAMGTCVDNCCQGKLGDPLLSRDPIIEETFRRNQYYDIIQNCWHSAQNYTGSVEAAVTFVLYNPNNVGMYNRLQDLYKIFDINEKILPRMEPFYHTQYRRGVTHYTKEEWGQCVYYMESSIGNFMRSTNRCRAQCTYPYDKVSSELKASSFVSAAEEIVRNTGACRAHCYDDLQLLPFTASPYLASLLEYLQFCQYTLGSMQDAADSAYSYTLLHSRNIDVNDNINIFRDDYSMELKARQDIQEFLKNHKLDMELLKEETEHEDLEEVVIFKGDNYYGTKGFLTIPQCKALIRLAEEVAIENDGYDYFKHKGTSPFNANEKFSGIELRKAVELLEEEKIDYEEVQLYLDVIKAAKSHIEQKLKIIKPLYFDYVHLVKRSALESSKIGSKYSHPVHGDNCIIQTDGSCIKQKPAFTHRDWSAIIYLNRPQKGGEFIITDRSFKVTESLLPACGDIVGFTADILHGVNALEVGERYIIGLWYTHDISKAQDIDLLQRKIDEIRAKEGTSKDEL